MGKTTTAFRLSDAEIETLDGIAAEEGSNRTAVVRKAIKNYASSRNSKKNIPAQAAEIYKTSISGYESHPIMKRIASKGIEVNDSNGNKITTITSLTKLLDFVDKKVFNYGDV